MTILAWVVIILVNITWLLYPLLIGQEKKPYSYSGWLATVIEAGMLTLLALRVLGKI